MGVLLVIDDDPHIRELVLALLDRAGFASLRAEDGCQALRVGEQQVDLCIVDAMMPHLDRVEFCRAARRYHPELPLPMLTAKGRLGDKTRGFEAGADDYLVKPFEGAELREGPLIGRFGRQGARVRAGEPPRRSWRDGPRLRAGNVPAVFTGKSPARATVEST